MDSNVRHLRSLEKENARLKKLLTERDLEIEVMKEVNAKKNCERVGAAVGGSLHREPRDLAATRLLSCEGCSIDPERRIRARSKGSEASQCHEGSAATAPEVRLSENPDPLAAARTSSVIGRLKAKEIAHRDNWSRLEDIEYATLVWTD
ncbi:MAG: hypothetical protein V2J02_01500 [Pseudomonadales bacterium]|nr:hypothetical protein [Pseudomonadales bacterium]